MVVGQCPRLNQSLAPGFYGAKVRCLGLGGWGNRKFIAECPLESEVVAASAMRLRSAQSCEVPSCIA